MKIAMIGQKGFPAKSGGIEKHVEILARLLAKHGHQVIIYTCHYYTPRQIRHYQGIKLISLSSWRSKNFDTASHVFLASLHAIFKEKPDIIHYHGIGPSLFLWLPRILSPQIKTVATFHCRDYYHQKWSLIARSFLRLGELCTIYLSHKTIAVSHEIQDYIQNRYHRYATYLPNGILVESNYSLPTKKERQILAAWQLEKKEYILAVSRLVRHKGIHTLIAAYQKIPQQVIGKKKLVIVGSPAFTQTYAQEIHKLAHNDTRIIFTGEQFGAPLATLFRNAYLFVQPSESEGLSVALLEALYYNLPVLVSDIPANKEVVKGNGFLFRNRDIDHLAQKISQILRTPSETLLSEGKKGHQKIQREYNWSQIVAQTESLYHQCLVNKALNHFQGEKEIN